MTRGKTAKIHGVDVIMQMQHKHTSHQEEAMNEFQLHKFLSFRLIANLIRVASTDIQLAPKSGPIVTNAE